MNEVQIFNSPKFGDIRTVEVNGKPHFIAIDVARALGYRNTRDAILKHCRWVVKCDVPHPQSKSASIEVNVIPEGDIYRLVAHSELPAAEEFESWIFDEVIPTIRKTGTYSVNPVANLRQQEAEARLRNARSREANMYYKLAEKYPNNPLYQQVLHSKATEALAGRALIPLPEVEERLYSATEMGKKLGLSKNMIGRISEKYSLKTEQWGKWHEDVSPHNGKEVQTFRYKAAAIEKFQQCWELEQQERQKSKPLEVVKGGAAQ